MFNKKKSFGLLLFFVMFVAIIIILYSSSRDWNPIGKKETATIDNSSEILSSKNEYQSITMGSIAGWYIGYSGGETVDQSNEYADTGDADAIVLLKMTHLKTKDEVQTRVQYLPVIETFLKENFMDSIVEEPYLAIIKLYNFNRGLYAAQYQNFNI